jgi:aldose 1-epimerase
MAVSVQTRTQPGVKGLDPTIIVLDDGSGGRAEVWPALGFNCFRWTAAPDGRTLDLLYADPALFADGRPTRSGVPILFPFPNRIRDGRYSWDGREYQLPLNDSARKNAIHGFVCRRPWRVVDQQAGDGGASVTGEFHSARDAADCRGLWPADYRLRVRYALTPGRLRFETEISNPDDRPLPFGLGFHPYFRMPFGPGAAADDCTVEVPARAAWRLEDSLPTGDRVRLDPEHSLAEPRRFGELQLDNVLTALPDDAAAPRDSTEIWDLYERARLRCGAATLRLLCSDVFRELVVFTPPHRQAFCVEPYTCATDAVNLEARGVAAGWRTLRPGGRGTAVFELRVQ